MGSQHWQDMVDVLTQDGHGSILVSVCMPAVQAVHGLHINSTDSAGTGAVPVDSWTTCIPGQQAGMPQTLAGGV